MAKLIYLTNTSLDGFIKDAEGSLDWTVPDEEFFTFINDHERSIGTYLYGRGLYEAMLYWETEWKSHEVTPLERDFAGIWQGADKVVYSKTLETVSSTRTRIERNFDPQSIRQMKEDSPTDITVGGANLASQAISHDLVDEIGLLVAPVILGSGKPCLPECRLNLRLMDERRFASGVLYLRYQIKQ